MERKGGSTMWKYILAVVFVLAIGMHDLMAGAVITSGRIAIGVNDEGHLNVPAGTNGISTQAPEVGIAYDFSGAGDWQDATAPGCLCEGWGVSGNGISGYANVSSDGGAVNLTVDSFTSDASSITSSVHLTSLPGLSVTQAYSPSSEAPGALFVNNVTITNTTGADMTDVRYVRVMDWDIPPTEFDEYVTIVGTATTTDLAVSHDDGFESADPLAATDPLDPATLDVDFEDNGPDDHGAYFRFDFGDLADGESKEFSIYYGGAANEADMLSALGAVGIELFSLGQSNSGSTPGNDLPTYAFGFKGVGGDIVLPPPDGTPVPEPGTFMLMGIGLAGLGAVARRRLKKEKK